jgi:formylglycine-generating enzyme required for sulfatase activity
VYSYQFKWQDVCISNGVSHTNTYLLLMAADYSRMGYRLPTEAEWEYACRAGSQTDYYWGNQFDTNYAFYSSLDDGPEFVAKKRSNAFGLFDMLGNVWEWCGDWYATYPSDVQTDPVKGASNDSTFRVLRGGGYAGYMDMDGWRISNDSLYLRSGYRTGASPAYFEKSVGFRCVLPVSSK